MERVYEFLRKSNVYYLATMCDGKPKVRPFGTIDLYDGKLYIQTGKVKDVSKQMIDYPFIEISSMYDGRWIRITAEVVLDDNIEAQKHMLESYPSLKKMYSAGDGNTQVFYLKNACAKIYSFIDNVIEINF